MKNSFLLILGLFFSSIISFSQAIIIDHNCSKLEPIPASAINLAKQNLHIAYGHTSHGSQLTTGMTGLIGQTNLVGYKGDIYDWNEGGTDGALDIDDYFVSGDLGHNGDITWAQDTRPYLDNPDNSDVNVVIWSWCGGVSDNTTAGIQTYLDKMNELEQDYPDVNFVYMTGHSDIWSDATVKASNQQIRDYCIENNKILFDFYDIERYNPDGTFFEFTNDNCNYYDAAGGTQLGNWATEWQDSHSEGVDWYSCSSAHSEPLNANMKAYASWWLWCRIAGWEGVVDIKDNKSINSMSISPNPTNDFLVIKSENQIKEIEITDINGKIINSKIIINNNKIDVSKLRSGIYFIRINKTTTQKFIKK